MSEQPPVNPYDPNQPAPPAQMPPAPPMQPAPPNYAPPVPPAPPAYGQQPPAPGYPQPQYAAAPPQSNGLATAALVVGIIGILGCWIPFIGLLLPVVAIALGIAGLSRAKKLGASNGMSLTGLILGIVGVVLGLVITVFTAFIFSKVADCATIVDKVEQQQCINDKLISK